jgi:hypothetical protein
VSGALLRKMKVSLGQDGIGCHQVFAVAGLIFLETAGLFFAKACLPLLPTVLPVYTTSKYPQLSQDGRETFCDHQLKQCTVSQRY